MYYVKANDLVKNVKKKYWFGYKSSPVKLTLLYKNDISCKEGR